MMTDLIFRDHLLIQKKRHKILCLYKFLYKTVFLFSLALHFCSNLYRFVSIYNTTAFA